MAKGTYAEEREEEVLEDSESEARVYELGFHLDPELPSEEVKKAYHALHGLVAKDGTIVAEGEPVMMQLAYTISRQETSGRRDFNSAHFAWIVYEATAAGHARIVKAVGADTHIVRFIDLLTTKEAARHAVEMRELSMKTSESASESEESIGTELDAALENVAV